MLGGIVGLRWGTWAWMAATLAWEFYDRGFKDDKPDMPHPLVALTLVLAAGAFTALTSYWLREDPARLLDISTVVAELVLGAALLMADDWVWNPIAHTQNLASAWPVVGVIVAGMGYGRRAGVAAGVFLGVAGYLGIPIGNDGDVFWSLSRLSSAALFIIAGWAAGYVTGRLSRAEQEIASARAREEVARTLHDGVLQTLAVIQRRSGDAELTAMAREQEVELRSFLTGATVETETLAATLRTAAARHERHHGARVQVVVVEDLPDLADEVVDAIGGAVGEALTNATKHGGASSITIYVEPTDGDGVFCSVKDDGSGFDPAVVTEGIGLSRSIRGRLDDVGGRVEISSRPGRGADVKMWAGE